MRRPLRAPCSPPIWTATLGRGSSTRLPTARARWSRPRAEPPRPRRLLHDPEVDLLAGNGEPAVRSPVAHVEGVRDHARARPELLELRSQHEIELRQQIEGNDRGRAEIELEEVALDDLYPARHAGAPRVLPRFGD